MFIDTPDEGSAEGAVAQWFASQRQGWGFLPDYAGCFATRPEVAQAWLALSAAVRDGVDRRRFEIATIAAARVRRSTYCTVAHTSFLRDVCHDEETVATLTAAPDGTSLAGEDAAIFGFATKVAQDAASVEQADVDALRALGLTDADVADLVFAVGARMFFTTVLDGLGARLDRATADTFDDATLASMLVGREVGD